VPLTEKGAVPLASALGGIADGLDDLAGGARAAVDLIVARARKLAPVDTGKLSGSMRGTGDGSTATVGSSVAYGLPVHFGVPSRGQRPRPFLHQAVDAEQTRIVDAYTTDVSRLIEQKV
jgi:hypothetical protein